MRMLRLALAQINTTVGDLDGNARLVLHAMEAAQEAKADLVAIGRRIRELRAMERQDDFAPELGITQGQLSKIERGVLAPSIDMLLRLRERFRKSVDWILIGE